MYLLAAMVKQVPSPPQELKLVGIVTFWRCFVTFCVFAIA